VRLYTFVKRPFEFLPVVQERCVLVDLRARRNVMRFSETAKIAKRFLGSRTDWSLPIR
jgi:hypothetical protein